MRYRVTILIALALAGVTVFLASRHLAAHWCATQLEQPTDELEWLRTEFRLNESDLARVRKLHEGYLPQCRDICERIDANRRELLEALTAGTNTPAEIEQRLGGIAALRTRCQVAMLEHFREVSQAMPPEQGRRYLAEMQRLTLGYHERIEHAMPSDAPSQHGHR